MLSIIGIGIISGFLLLTRLSVFLKPYWLNITTCLMHLRLHELITTYSSANNPDAHVFQDIKKSYNKIYYVLKYTYVLLILFSKTNGSSCCHCLLTCGPFRLNFKLSTLLIVLPVTCFFRVPAYF